MSSEWRYFRLGDPNVATITLGQSPPSETYNNSGYGLPFFQGKADFGPRSPKVRLWCSAPLRVAEPNDILISVRAPVGDVNIADQRCSIGRGLAAIRSLRLDHEFLYYALIFAKPLLEAEGTGSTFDSINRYTLENFQVTAPSDIEEQRAIARTLRAMQRAAEIEARTGVTLAALKAATMAKLFREGLRGEPLKQTEIGEIPESWEVKPVSAVADAVSGGTPSKQRTDWWSGSIPWASPKDMKRLRLRDTEDHVTPEAAESGSRIVPPKTVFIVVRGMVLAKDVPVAITEAPMAFNQDMKALLPSERIHPDFLLYALCARKSALIQEIGTSAHGTRRMSGSSVDGLLIPVPRDREEQQDIAATLHMLDRREEISKERVRCLQSLFSSTLHSLMTGAIRVKDLDLAEVSHA